MFDSSSRLAAPHGTLFVTDAGARIDTTFDRACAPDAEEGAVAARRLRALLRIARETGMGLALDASAPAAVTFAAALRAGIAADIGGPVLINARIRGDRASCAATTEAQARAAFATEMDWLSETEIDLATSPALHGSAAATGFSRAASGAWLRHAVTFAVGEDGRLASGETLAEAIRRVDLAANGAPAWYLATCADPLAMARRLEEMDPARRVRGLRAVRPGTAEEEAATLAMRAEAQLAAAPWLTLFEVSTGAADIIENELLRAA